MAWLELKIPPVGVFLIVAGGIAALSDWGLRAAPVGAPRWWLVSALTLGAIVLGLAAVARFGRAGTTVNPMDPSAASTVVTEGVYSVTRNPMYLALLLCLMAWSVYLGATVAWVLPFVFVAYMTRFQIQPEERALRAAFGAPYESYLRRVRRWI